MLDQTKRGEYRFKNRGRQLLLFDGMNYGETITPMDIDCTLEYRDRAVVLIEIKKACTAVPLGERKTLERYVRDFARAGKRAIAIVADHQVMDTREDVHVAECIVRELYLGSELRWRPPKKYMSVRELVDSFLSLVD